MPRCDLRLTLDRGQGPYRIGETITGVVEVDASERVKCDGLKVRLQRWTHGKGNRDVGDLLIGDLFVGTWEAGEYRYPFELTIPESARPYRGTLMNVEHRVTVDADIPWAFDPEASIDVAITPPDPTPLTVARENPTEEVETVGGSCLGCSAFFWVLGLGALAVAGGDDDAFPMSVILCALGFVSTVFAVRRILSERALGAVRMRITQPQSGGYRDAERRGLLVSLGVKSSANVKRMLARLVVREEATSGSGSNRRTHRHALWTREGDLRETEEAGWYAVELELPEPGAVEPSFSTGSNQLVWEVRFEVDIADRPDWDHTEKLVARAS